MPALVEAVVSRACVGLMEVDEESSQQHSTTFQEPLTDIDRLQYWLSDARWVFKEVNRLKRSATGERAD